jgi:class 3 adenylate cyclase/pimeloyl-ACP methyl ester carboxylesterase
VDRPETRYARTIDGVHIAYQVVGEGPFDLVFAPGWISNVDVVWDLPFAGPFLRRLASISRLIVFDRRGSGVSDRPPREESLALEFGIDDIRAVMDAAGSSRAVLFGIEDGGILSAVFAGAHPDRTQALILFAAWARYRFAPDFPWGWTDEETDEWEEHIRSEWGTEAFWRYHFETLAPSMANDPELISTWTWFGRLCSSPDAILAIERSLHEVDGRAVMPSIQVPTLVMHREGDRAVPVDHSRWIASQIPGAKLVVLPGVEHTPFIGDPERILGELEGFVTELREEEATFDRALASVLFTDIVGSTERAVELGDRGWHELVERHHGVVRAMLARYRGHEVDTAGDGFFATFDGPARAIRCALAITDAVRSLGLEIRAGLHVGEVQVMDGGVRGVAVNIGARVGALAGASEVLVSQTVKDLVAGSGIAFDDAGEHELKGIPDRWRLYRVAH